jgi:hypothetical protein
MNLKILHRIIGASVLAISLTVLWSTVQPSVSFWDPGERLAASYYLQIPHPPGSPFYILLGKIFSLLPFDWNPAYKINLLSTLTGSLSVFFLYLIAVKLIENFRGKKPQNLLYGLATYISAAIGALSLSFSDTFWFTAVEAETDATSAFLYAFTIWLMIRWYERADEKDNEKYLLLIAYIVGISIGVHLVGTLLIVPCVLIVIFRKYVQDEEVLKKTGYIFLGHVAVLILIAVAMWSAQTSTTPPTSEEYNDYDSQFKLIIGGISVLIMGIFWKKIFNRNSFYVAIIVAGVSLFFVYPGIVKYLPSLMAEVGGDNTMTSLIFLLVLLSVLGYGVYYAVKKNKPALHLLFMSIMLIVIGYTTYAMIIIRSNLEPPMNQNEPNKMTVLISYLNREQFGDFPTFKRRFSNEPHQQGIYTNYSSDLDFFYRYQMNHMMTRYWLWNYAGREGWAQDDGANVAPFNFIGNIFGKLFAVNFNGKFSDSLMGIPLLIGLFGIYYHFRRDWKMATIFMVAFILLGYLTAFYQNQQQPQPRERDYFYVGAFFVFSIWIAIGVQGLVDLVKGLFKKESYGNAAVIGVLAFTFVLVPIKMLDANYHTHDRSRNWVPWDYSYNILQSAAPNAVLFTNGDNDTFPLWYLQDVEGVRRDVKVVNLSLLNTDWYVRQLKNNDPYGVGTVRFRIPDARINPTDLRPTQWSPTDITIPTPRASTPEEMSRIVSEYAIKDTSAISAGTVTWKMPNTLTFGDIKAIRVQDIMVREIVEANNWERPIYFAVTCSDDSKIGLQDYLKMEGMTFRLVPEKRKPGSEFINEELVKAHLKGNEVPSKSYLPGFRFTGLNDPTIFFDDNHTRMVQNYRNAFMRLAVYYRSIGDNQNLIATLDDMNEKLPYQVLGMDNGLLFEVANLYFFAGDREKYKEIYTDVEARALNDLEKNPDDVQSYYNPYRLLIEIYENTEQYDKLLSLWQRLETMFPNDPTVKSNIEKYQQMIQPKDTSGN